MRFGKIEAVSSARLELSRRVVTIVPRSGLNLRESDVGSVSRRGFND